jgi:ribosomal protein L11
LEKSESNSETGYSEQTDPDKMVPSASALLTQVLREPPRSRKTLKHNGNITFTRLSTVPDKIQQQSLAREFSGTIKEIPVLHSLWAAMWMAATL